MNLIFFLEQRIHNLTLPRWATQDVVDTLKRVASFEVMYSIHSHKRKEKARLSGGEDSHLEAINLKQSSEESVTRKRKNKKKTKNAVLLWLLAEALFTSLTVSSVRSGVSQKHISTCKLMGRR